MALSLDEKKSLDLESEGGVLCFQIPWREKKPWATGPSETLLGVTVALLGTGKHCKNTQIYTVLQCVRPRYENS